MSESSNNEDVGLNEEEQSSADEEDEEVASDEEAEEQAEDDESGAEEPDINASATESDEDDDDDDDEVDDDEDIPAKKKQKVQTQSSKNVAKITDAITERHEKRKGRQLYIRFPEKLPESMEEFQEKVKSLSKLIVEGHKPRQKHARFCLVDFANTEDRDKTLEELKSKQPKIFVSLPKTDDDEFIKNLIDKKLKQTEKKRAKNLLRKQNKKNVIEKKFTSTLMVLNLPKGATKAQIKELFPNAVDIQTKGASGKYTDKMIATVNLPSTEDARTNSKRKLVLGGNDLIIRFNNNVKKRGMKKNKKNPKKATPGGDAKLKGPLAPEILEAKKSDSPKKPTQSPKKRSISENGDSSVPQKKAKGNKPLPSGKKGNKAKNGAPSEKPNKKNKQKNKSPQKGKSKSAPAE